MDEIEILRGHRPPTSGPPPEVTERAREDFGRFLANQHPVQAITKRGRMRRRRRWAIPALALLLVGTGGVALGALGFLDGVIYERPAKEIITTDDLTLVVQESNLGPCLEVRTEEGGMSGGCGADLEEPLSVAVGVVDGKSFVSGWAPPGTVQVRMTFPDGDTVSVTNLHRVEGYPVVFFLASPVPSTGGEPMLPVEVSAFDQEGRVLHALTP